MLEKQYNDTLSQVKQCLGIALTNADNHCYRCDFLTRAIPFEIQRGWNGKICRPPPAYFNFADHPSIFFKFVQVSWSSRRSDFRFCAQ